MYIGLWVGMGHTLLRVDKYQVSIQHHFSTDRGAEVSFFHIAVLLPDLDAFKNCNLYVELYLNNYPRSSEAALPLVPRGQRLQ